MIKKGKAKKHFFWTATPKFLVHNEETISMDHNGYFGDKYELFLDEAIEKEYISDYIVRINSKNNVETKLINIFTDRLTRPWKSVIFFNRMEKADEIRDLLRENLEGYKIYSFHSKSKGRKILKTFSDNKRCILCVCDMLSLGYDQPDIDAVIHYNVTQSPILHIQRNGRGQRVSPNKQCNSVYYFVNKAKDISTIITHLSEHDKRLLGKYSIQPIYNNKVGNSHSGGKVSCVINLNEPIELTREMVYYFSEKQESKMTLRGILRYRNRYRVTCIDRQQVIQEYGALFPDIQVICESVENFPEFCLSPKRYTQYTSDFTVNSEEIYAICEKNNIYTPERYKKRCSELNLPSYEFILNGGVTGIKNLYKFLPKSVKCEEN